MKSCIECESWTLKGSGDMGKMGFANCANRRAWEFYSRDHHCERFKELDADKVNARVVWLDKQKG